MSNIVTTKKAEDLPSSTTSSTQKPSTVSSTTLPSNSLFHTDPPISSTTTTTTMSSLTTKSIETSTKSGSVKWSSQSAFPDPFLDLSTTSTEQTDTLRPHLEADNVNYHLDSFVSSILAQINQSIPDLLDQLTTESLEDISMTTPDTLSWVDN